MRKKRVFPFEHGTHTHILGHPSALFTAMTRLTLKSCTGPTGLSSGRLVTGRVDTKIRFSTRSRGYHARLRATVTEFSSSLPFPSLPALCMYGQRGGSRSWVALPPNKLSPPRHLHKSIKSALVEFEASRPPLVIYRYETRIGAGENVRQMFARLESILHLGWKGRSFLLSLLLLFYSFVVLVLCNCFMWLVKKFSFRRAR